MVLYVLLCKRVCLAVHALFILNGIIIIKMYANFVIFEIYLTDWESGPIVESEMRTFSFQGM
jgi:hypothetical protein